MATAHRECLALASRLNAPFDQFEIAPAAREFLARAKSPRPPIFDELDGLLSAFGGIRGVRRDYPFEKLAAHAQAILDCLGGESKPEDTSKPTPEVYVDEPCWFRKKLVRAAAGHRSVTGIIVPMSESSFQDFKREHAVDIHDDKGQKLKLRPSFLERLYRENDTRPTPVDRQ